MTYNERYRTSGKKTYTRTGRTEMYTAWNAKQRNSKASTKEAQR